MCVYCDMWGDGLVWYLNPKNYARQMYTIRPRVRKAEAPKGEADPNSYIKSQKAVVDAMEIGAEAYIAAQNKRKGLEEEIAKGGHEGRVGGWIGQVVPLRDMEKMVEIADPLGLIGCICRLRFLGKEEQNAAEFTCMGMGVGMLKWERWPERYKKGVTWVSIDEAKEWLRDMDRRGFVHSLMLFDERFIAGICNCDFPMCDAITQRLDFGYNLLKGHYVAEVDENICNGCGICAQRCQFGALKFNVTTDKAGIDPFRCFGCGVCETACPRKAIRLLDRMKIPSLKEVW